MLSRRLGTNQSLASQGGFDRIPDSQVRLVRFLQVARRGNDEVEFSYQFRACSAGVQMCHLFPAAAALCFRQAFLKLNASHTTLPEIGCALSNAQFERPCKS